MKTAIKILFVLIFMLYACAPSENAVNTAIAQTQAALPTATFTITPQPTSTPTKTPTRTPNPTATFAAKDLILLINSSANFLNEPVEVVDIRYEDGTQGKNTIMHIDAKSTADKYEDMYPTLLGILNALYRNGIKFQDNLFALNIVEYDKNLARQKLVVATWADLISWFNNEITAEQLILRLLIFP